MGPILYTIIELYVVTDEHKRKLVFSYVALFFAHIHCGTTSAWGAEARTAREHSSAHCRRLSGFAGHGGSLHQLWPIDPVMLNDLHIEAGQAGLMSSLLFLGLAVAYLPAGIFVDLYGQRPVLIGSIC